ncbi:glycosyltransferase family 1 protein [Trametes coccinea BRFM310]|uniref:Glycosyltransferase family 1 protein n=1 Tax=Trametes coccinea (strain BRFM310) TaxID=1353009 RepID=A0A1Y2IUL9_TRAC3|nr:glycosyltransferase family 1 protein [Trametes coccinea BRFM310]
MSSLKDTPPESHLVAFAYEAWGHTRSLIVFCARAVKARSIIVTMFMPISFYDRATAELARNFEPGEEAYLSRVRIIALERGESITATLLNVGFATSWRKLVDGEELVCAKTGQRYSPVIPPRAAILDCFAHQPVLNIRELSGNEVKVYIWFPGMLSALLYFFSGAESVGGRESARRKAEEEAKRSGGEVEEIMAKIMFKTQGEIVRIPGIPPMYEYEYHPQDFPMPQGITYKLLLQIYDSIVMADGLFVATPESYEPKAVAATREWYDGMSKPVYVVGPLQAAGTQAAKYEQEQSAQAPEIRAFLDYTLNTAGERSLLYISFGSIFWPAKSPEILWAFLDVVMELNIPFILSHASAAAVIPVTVVEKVKQYGRGFMSSWVPQQLILNHPVTGWFVTHGGHNSVLESLVAGIPQIFWPHDSDQPVNAVHLTENFDAAYELIEVRTGLGLKPIYRNGKTPVGTLDAVRNEARYVLTRAFGEEGLTKRARLLKLREAVLAEWNEPCGENPGGASRRDFIAFMDSL